jgi:hypothetical protein
MQTEQEQLHYIWKICNLHYTCKICKFEWNLFNDIRNNLYTNCLQSNKLIPVYPQTFKKLFDLIMNILSHLHICHVRGSWSVISWLSCDKQVWSNGWGINILFVYNVWEELQKRSERQAYWLSECLSSLW